MTTHTYWGKVEQDWKGFSSDVSFQATKFMHHFKHTNEKQTVIPIRKSASGWNDFAG